MYISDDEKDGRKAALQKLMDLMGSETGKRLGGLKKPVAASMTIEKIPSDMEDDDDVEMDSKDDDSLRMGDQMDDNEPSEDEKAQIAKLYHKYC